MDAVDQPWLERFVRDHGGVAGTVHRVRAGELLLLTAAFNIPEQVVALVERVPLGKGMAGLAYERKQAISTCNIQTDDTGQVRPGAKMIGAQAGVALPVFDGQGVVRAVVGIAYKEERSLLESELASLDRAAARLP
jgi:L-methionine (R)-S-oxide reductase